jgi:hypothetical protein
MRVGCFGCLLLIAIILTIGVAAFGFIFLSGNIMDLPDNPPTSTIKRADGHSAQQKLFELLRRDTGHSTRSDPVVFSEAEANAFLANHLVEVAELPVQPLVLKFGPGNLEVQGQTKVRNLFLGTPLARTLQYLPETTLEKPLWLTLRGRVTLEEGVTGGRRQYGRVQVTEFMIGKQPLGTWLVSLILGSRGAPLLRWQVPAVVSEIAIEPGRMVVRTK